jgi:hypothetical protein
MTKDTEKSRVVIWERLQEVRGSYQDPKKLKSLIEKWEEDFGPEYKDIIDEMISTGSRNFGSEMSSRHGKSIDDFVRTVWTPWEEGEFTIEKLPDGVKFCVTKCPMADVFRSIGRIDLGLQFYCNEDRHIAAGFNSAIKFTRTKTLMEGNDCCDQCYILK